MAKYKTPANERRAAKEKRDKIKAAGGQAYADLLAKERAKRAEFRKRHPDHRKAVRRKEQTRPGYFKKRLLMVARRRGRKKGVEATIRVSDLHWPTHCPILGIELDYTTKRGHRRCDGPANPSLDRLDPNQGYIPGNVFVVSFRANTLKNNANIEELEAILRYMRGFGRGVEDLSNRAISEGWKQ